MDLGFERQDWRRRADAQAGADAPEWGVLHARLAAAWSARRAIAAASPSAMTGGSFDRQSAHGLAALKQELPAVNPTALGNGKPAHGMWAIDTGANSSGDRGLK